MADRPPLHVSPGPGVDTSASQDRVMTMRSDGCRTDREAASALPGGLRSKEFEHLREMTAQARIAFEVARDAFVRLEAAHEEGRSGAEENATFLAKVTVFRQDAEAVHHAVEAVR